MTTQDTASPFSPVRNKINSINDFATIRHQQRLEVLALIKEAHKLIKYKKSAGDTGWAVIVEGIFMGTMQKQNGVFGSDWVTHGVKEGDLEWKAVAMHPTALRPLEGHRTRDELARRIVHARLMIEAGFDPKNVPHYYH